MTSHSDVDSYTILDCCSGVGMLGLGVEIAIGNTQPLAYVERDAYAAACLVARMEAGALHAAPIWDDIATFPASSFHGCVDILCAGYPCQPFSLAGKQRGTADERHIWPHILRIIRRVQPGAVFLENVANHFNIGFGPTDPMEVAISGSAGVVSDLQGCGYEVEAGIFTASEVGAAHRRRRMFVLAYRNSGGRPQYEHQPWRGKSAGAEYGPMPFAAGGAMADADECGRSSRGTHAGGRPGRQSGGEGAAVGNAKSGDKRRQRPGASHKGLAVGGSGDAVGNAGGGELPKRDGLREFGGQEQPASPGTDPPVFAPGPNDPRWAAILERWPWLHPAAEPSVYRVVDGNAAGVDKYRRHRLRCIGNSIVPLCAAYAFAELDGRHERRRG